ETSTNPPCTATLVWRPPGSSMMTAPMPRAPMNGACPVRKAMSPSLVRATTISASPVHRMRSGETSSTCRLMGSAALELLGLGPGGLGATDVQEGLLGQVVQLAVDEQLEGLDRLLDRRGHTGEAGEDLGHVHRLRQEPLDLAGPV